MYFVIVQIFIVLREFKPVTNTHSSLMEMKSSLKGSSFLTETSFIKLLGVANLQSLKIHCSSKIAALVPQEHQIRMRSD